MTMLRLKECRVMMRWTRQLIVMMTDRTPTTQRSTTLYGLLRWGGGAASDGDISEDEREDLAVGEDVFGDDEMEAFGVEEDYEMEIFGV